MSSRYTARQGDTYLRVLQILEQNSEIEIAAVRAEVGKSA